MEETQNKSHENLKKKLGIEGYRQHMANIGAKGGKKQVKKGLYFTKNQFIRRKRTA